MLFNTFKILKKAPEASQQPPQNPQTSQSIPHNSNTKSISKSILKSGSKPQPSLSSNSIQISNLKSIQNLALKLNQNSGLKSIPSSDSKSIQNSVSKVGQDSEPKSIQNSKSNSIQNSKSSSNKRSQSKSVHEESSNSPKGTDKLSSKTPEKSPTKSSKKSFFASIFKSKPKETPKAAVNEVLSSEEEEEAYDPHNLINIESTPYIRILKKYQDYLNSTVEQTYRSLGRFEVDANYEIKLMYKKQIMISKDKAIYSGFVDKKGRPSDVGVMVWPSGVLHEGRFSVGQAWGHGRRITTEGITYEGDWDDGLLEGLGRIESKTMIYVGEISKNLPHGQGTEIWQNGDIYEGEFFEGKKNGKGKFKWHNGSAYEGMVENNAIHGTGTYTWKDGRKYTGEWVKNNMDGQGSYYWPDGRTYTGKFLKGKRDGYGVLDWTNENRFLGTFRKGKFEGLGTMYLPEEHKIITTNYSAGEVKNIVKEISCIYEEVIVRRIEDAEIVVIPSDSKPISDLKHNLELALKPVVVEPPRIPLKTDEETIKKEFNELIGPFSNHPLYKKLLLIREKLGPFLYDCKEFDFDVDIFLKDWFLSPDGYYKGELNEEGLRYGRGVLINKGSIYEGYFKDNQYEGLGRLYDIHDMIYEGYWHKGQKFAFGCLWIKGVNVYSGEWLKDMKTGLGRLEDPEYTYEGNLHENIIQGKGMIKWKTNCNYKGEFKNNLPHGYGVYVSFDGQGFAGIWKKGILTKAALNTMNNIKKVNLDGDISVPSILSIQSINSHNSFQEIPSIEIKAPPIDRDSFLDNSDVSTLHFGTSKPMKFNNKPTDRDSLLFDPNASKVKFSKISGPMKLKSKPVERDSLLFEPNESAIRFGVSTKPNRLKKEPMERDSLLFDPDESQIRFGVVTKHKKLKKEPMERDSLLFDPDESKIRFGVVTKHKKLANEPMERDSLLFDPEDSKIRFGVISDSSYESEDSDDKIPDKLYVSICPRELDIPDEFSDTKLTDLRLEDVEVTEDSLSIRAPMINSILSFGSEYNKADYSDENLTLNQVYLNVSKLKTPFNPAQPQIEPSPKLTIENSGPRVTLRNLSLHEKILFNPQDDKSSITVARFDKSSLRKSSIDISQPPLNSNRNEGSKYIKTKSDYVQKDPQEHLEDIDNWSDIEEEKISHINSSRDMKNNTPQPRGYRDSTSFTNLKAKFPSPMIDYEHDIDFGKDSSLNSYQHGKNLESFDVSITSKDFRQSDESGKRLQNMSLYSNSFIKFPTPSGKDHNFIDESDRSCFKYLNEVAQQDEATYSHRNQIEKQSENISEFYPQPEVSSSRKSQLEKSSKSYIENEIPSSQRSRQDKSSKSYIEHEISSSHKSQQDKSSKTYTQHEVSSSRKSQLEKSSKTYTQDEISSSHKSQQDKSSKTYTQHEISSSHRVEQDKSSKSYTQDEISYNQRSQTENASRNTSEINPQLDISSTKKSKSKKSYQSISSQSVPYEDSYKKQGKSISKLDYQYVGSEYLDQAPDCSEIIEQDSENLMKDFSYCQYSDMIVSEKSQSFIRDKLEEKDRKSRTLQYESEETVQEDSRNKKHRKKHKHSMKRSTDSEEEDSEINYKKKKHKHRKRNSSQTEEKSEEKTHKKKKHKNKKRSSSSSQTEDHEEEAQQKKKNKRRKRRSSQSGQVEFLEENKYSRKSSDIRKEESSHISQEIKKDIKKKRRSMKEHHEEAED